MTVTGAANGTLSALTTNGVYDIGALSGAHQITVNAGVTGVDWRIGALNTTTTYSGAFAAGILRKRGTGALTMNGNITTASQKIVEGGSLILAINACIQNVANSYDVAAGATLRFSPTAALAYNVAMVNAGAMEFGGNQIITVGNLFIDSLTGTANIITGCTVQFKPVVYNSTAAWTVNGAFMMAIGGGNITLGSLAGAGTIAKQTATLSTLNIGGNNQSTTWSGTFGGGGSLRLNKNGTGTFTMSGTSTAWTFDTFNINAGTVLVTGANALPSIGAIGTFIEVNNGGTLTLAVNMTGTRSIRVNAGGICNKGGFTHTGTTFTGVGTINP